MAKEKIEVELEPTVSPSGLRRLQQQIATTPIAKGLDTHISGHGEALASRLGLGEAAGKTKSLVAGIQAGEIGAAAAAFTGVGIALVGAMGAAKAFSATMNEVASLVGVRSPAKLKIFEDTWNDIYAVIGDRLEPVLDIWTESLRMAGDALQTVLPSQAEFASVMEEFRPLMKEVRAAMIEAAPVIKTVLIEALRQSKDAVMVFVSALRALIALGKSMPGGSLIFGEGKAPLQSSFGMAARGASIVSGEELSRSAIIGALQMGAGNPQERTAKATEDTATAAQSIAGALVDAFNPLSGIAKARELVRKFQ